MRCQTMLQWTPQRKTTTEKHLELEKKSGEGNVDRGLQVQLEEDGVDRTRQSGVETSGLWHGGVLQHGPPKILVGWATMHLAMKGLTHPCLGNYCSGGSRFCEDGANHPFLHFPAFPSSPSFHFLPSLSLSFPPRCGRLKSG